MQLVALLLMSGFMFALPHLTRREILFGVVLPADFRSRPEGRLAIRRFRLVVTISAVAGLIATLMLSPGFGPVAMLAPMATVIAGFTAFVIQNGKLKAFAVQPQPVRELELTGEPERLPWFAWLGLVPMLVLASSAVYVRNDRDLIRILILGAGMNLWLFGFSLAIWYGSRRSEPLRRPILGVFVILSWAIALTMPGSILFFLNSAALPYLPLIAPAVILGSAIYLIKKNRDSRSRLDSTPNECWKGGILYYNPNDPAMFVGRRDGAGFTLNMANPWGWAVVASPLLLGASSYFFMQ